MGDAATGSRAVFAAGEETEECTAPVADGEKTGGAQARDVATFTAL